MLRSWIYVTQDKLENLIRKPWYFGLFILLQIVAVPMNFASKNWSISGWMDILEKTFKNAFLIKVEFLYTPFQIFTITLILLLIVFKKRIARMFSIYASLTFFLQAIFQNMAFSEEYGFSFITVNVIMFPIVGLAWLWDALVQKTDFDYRSRSIFQYWAVPLAFFAFWAPKSLEHFLSLDLLYIFKSGTTFGLCLMVPVYLAVLLISYPRVNLITLSVTSIVGFIIAIYNMMMVVMAPQNWWHGIVHTPLFVVSLVGIILSLRRKTN